MHLIYPQILVYPQISPDLWIYSDQQKCSRTVIVLVKKTNILFFSTSFAQVIYRHDPELRRFFVLGFCRKRRNSRFFSDFAIFGNFFLQKFLRAFILVFLVLTVYSENIKHFKEFLSLFNTFVSCKNLKI